MLQTVVSKDRLNLLDWHSLILHSGNHCSPEIVCGSLNLDRLKAALKIALADFGQTCPRPQHSENPNTLKNRVGFGSDNCHQFLRTW